MRYRRRNAVCRLIRKGPHRMCGSLCIANTGTLKPVAGAGAPGVTIWTFLKKRAFWFQLCRRTDGLMRLFDAKCNAEQDEDPVRFRYDS